MPSRNTVEIVIQAKDEASKQVDSIFSGIVGQTAKIGLAMKGLKTIIDSTVGSLSDMARESAIAVNVEAAFAGVVAKSGKNMDEMLAALEKGSSGMVDQTSLMKSYNTAAQLVGTTFANQLPDAMAYLSKVSAATGQDMGYMLDSLVRGVGRLSPMILDNLGIQVDVVAANEAYAASIGKTVEELTKEEQQTALMNQVMQKLGENTAAMPDIADSAAASFARWDATVKNLKEGIGKALMPVFQRLMDAKIEFVQKISPLVIRAFEMISDALLKGMDVIDGFKLQIRGLIAWWYNFIRFVDQRKSMVIDALSAMFSPQIAYDALRVITSIEDGFGSLVTTIQKRLSGVIDAIQTFKGYLSAGFDPLRAFQYSLHQLVSDDVANTINRNINRIRSTIKRFRNDLASGMPFMSAVKDSMYELLPPKVADIVVGVIARIQNKFSELGTTLQSIWNENLQPLAESLGNFFSNLFGNISTDQIQKVGETLLSLLSPLGRIGMITDILGVDLVQVFRNMIDGVTQFFNTLSSSGSAIEGFVMDRFVTPFQEFWAQVGPALKAFGDWFLSTGWPKIASAVENAWVKVFVPLIDGLLNIWNVVAPGLGAILAWFISTGLPFIITKVTEFITTIGNVVGAIFDWINQNPQFVVAMGLLISVVGGAAAATTAWGIATGIASAAVGVLTGALALLFSPVTLIVAAIAGLVYLLSTGEGGIAGALSRAAVAAQQLSAIFLLGLLTAVNWVKARFDELVTTLENIVNWIDTAIEKVEKFLGISAGVTGLVGGINVGDIQAKAQQFSNPLAQPRALGGSGVPGVPYRTHAGETFIPNQPGRFEPNSGGGNVTINFNGAGPTSETEAQEYGRIIADAMQMLGAPA